MGETGVVFGTADEALARFFSVSSAYFFDDAQSQAITEELKLLCALADSGVKRVAARLGGLSADSLRNISDIIERVPARA